jgi:flagellar protein FliO/FliZ
MKQFFHRLCLYGLALLVCIGDALAAAPFAAPVTNDGGTSAGGAWRVSLALLLVVTLVFAAAWLMRRVMGTPAASSQRIQILAQVSLGARERAVLVRVGAQEVLLGVAPGNVRALHVSAAAESAPDAVVVTPAASGDLLGSFREVLRRSMGK